jgi:pyrrolysine biosynthesis protein PylC
MLESAGEHIMAEAGVLHRQHDFFGADDALTNYHPHRRDWAATLINTAETRRAAWEKRNRVLCDIRQHFGLDRYVDGAPCASDA